MKWLQTLASWFRPESPQERVTYYPDTPMSDPDDWLTDLVGGKTASGVAVNQQTALTYSPVFRAVSLIARDIARVPIFVYQRKGSGKERAREHPAFKLLRYSPHPVLPAYHLKLRLQANALLAGNGYALIERRADGTPRSLLPLDPSRVTPFLDGEDTVYVYETQASEKVAFPYRDVLHIRSLGDGYIGTSVIDKARENLGLALATERYGARFFKNDARPSVVLEHPGTLGDEALANLRQSWRKLHGSDGDERLGLAILEEGMKLNPFSITPENAQFLETRRFSVLDVANWFGVPPHKLGDISRTSYNSLEQENQSYLDEALDPWMAAWESECRLKLLTVVQQDRDSHVIEFERKALIRINLSDRFAAYNTAIQGGWMSRDEVRAAENLNPIPGGAGEEFMVPLNMGPASESEEDPPDESSEEVDDEPEVEEGRSGPLGPPVSDLVDSQRALVEDFVGRFAKRVTACASRRLKKRESFSEWLGGQLEHDHRGVFLSQATPLGLSLQATMGLGEDWIEGLAADFFDGVREAYGARDAEEDRARGYVEAELPVKLAQHLTGESYGTKKPL